MSDYIPFSIQAEIMKRLPTKSLMQFRTVSKAWKSLIDSSKFIVDYSANHTHQQHLLLSYLAPENFETKYVSIVDDDTFPHHKLSLTTPIITGLSMPTILGSSQGLFCLYSKVVDPHEPRRNNHTAVLWNPSIRKSVAIDVLSSATNVVTGFGVCPCTIDPKLVKIDYNYELSNLNTLAFSPWLVEVYNLSARAWRSIPTVNQPRNTIDFTEKQVVLDGSIYWLAIDCTNISMMTPAFQGYNLIMSFDLTSEEFLEVSLPDTLARSGNCSLVISKLKESLAVVDVVNDSDKVVYGVWMMEHGVSNSFTKLFTINSPDASVTTMLGFRRINEPIFATGAEYFGHDVFVHELHSEHQSYVRISGSAFSHSARSYMETLLLLDQ